MKKRLLFLSLLLALATRAFADLSTNMVQVVAATTGSLTTASSLNLSWNTAPVLGHSLGIFIASSVTQFFPIITQQGVTWTCDVNPGNQGTGPSFATACMGRVISNSAGGTANISQLGSTSLAAVAIGVEFTGTNLRIEQQTTYSQSGTANAVSMASAMTGINSSQLSIGIIVTRGQYANVNTSPWNVAPAANIVFTNPTNGYVILCQQNTNKNVSGGDRAIAVLAQVINNANTTNAIPPAGATMSAVQYYCGKHITLNETLQGFMQ